MDAVVVARVADGQVGLSPKVAMSTVDNRFDSVRRNFLRQVQKRCLLCNETLLGCFDCTIVNRTKCYIMGPCILKTLENISKLF